MATYQTLDYLPDLSATKMSAAGVLAFEPASSNSVGWDYSADVFGNENYAILHDTYRFTAKEGATYDIFSTSYFDPFLLSIYDKFGNTIVANDENDDGEDFLISGGYHSNDIIFNWKAPYTGEYYVSASWNQGNYYKFYALSVNEDIDTAIITVGSLDSILNNSFGMTRQQLGDWVVQHLNLPHEIYNVFSNNGITSNMLAEIVQPFLPEIVVTGVVVNDWLQANGQPALI